MLNHEQKMIVMQSRGKRATSEVVAFHPANIHPAVRSESQIFLLTRHNETDTVRTDWVPPAPYVNLLEFRPSKPNRRLFTSSSETDS